MHKVPSNAPSIFYDRENPSHVIHIYHEPKPEVETYSRFVSETYSPIKKPVKAKTKSKEAKK